MYNSYGGTFRLLLLRTAFAAAATPRRPHKCLQGDTDGGRGFRVVGERLYRSGQASPVESAVTKQGLYFGALSILFQKP